MRTGLAAAGLLMLLGGHAFAAPIECANIQQDLDRLACYDKEVGRTPTAAKPFSKGAWQVDSQTSALTDKTDVFISVFSDEVVNCGWNRGDKIRLTIRCLDNKTALIIDTQCHMTSSDYNSYGDVTYRLDADKARTVGMDASTNNRALGLWSGGKSIPVIKQMMGKAKMVVKLLPFGESPFTTTFSVGGLDEAVEPVKKACNW